MTKFNLGRKGVIWLNLSGHSPSVTEFGAEAQAGTDIETIGEQGSLAHSFWLVLGQLSYATQNHLPRDNNTHSGQDPPTSLNNQNNSP